MPSEQRVLLSDYVAGGDRIRERASEAVAKTGRSLEDIGDEVDMPKSQLSRVLAAGELNPPWRFLYWILRHDRKRIYVCGEAEEAEGEYRPKVVSAEEELAAYRAVLGEMGLDEIVRYRARLATKSRALKIAMGEDS